MRVPIRIEYEVDDDGFFVYFVTYVGTKLGMRSDQLSYRPVAKTENIEYRATRRISNMSHILALRDAIIKETGYDEVAILSWVRLECDDQQEYDHQIDYRIIKLGS